MIPRTSIISALFAAAAATFGAAAAAGTAGGADPTQPSGSTGGTGTATSDVPGSNAFPFDMHNYDRALAFGALLLNQADAKIDDWKEANAYNVCTFPDLTIGAKLEGPKPEPVPPNPPVPADSLKCWNVMVTTAYQLVECPDGEAFIARSGVGVNLQDRHTGDVYGWAEAYACDGSATPPSPGSPAKGGHTDSKRPLEFKLMEKRAL